ncbi:hypothetical protein OB955_08155 [Halobacteria archaeon AArc-m2/3/4]|uniref:Uncharacterized protein n=1 Tax=Natronoglomus mannanivorans TaxID=2979990 RepID=A0AAP2YX70_9EURY|nr:hypothetical protein [Halobacteria archaeon AArc-xg1-1]MCU4972710.1 hypothetical protein [Halobacteria archaeon AArc-m2/3/4]
MDSTGRLADDGTTSSVRQNAMVKAWATFVGSLFTLAGLGMGVFALALDTVAQEIEPPVIFSWELSTTVDIMMVAAVFVGLFLAWHLETDDRTASTVAGASMFVGMVGLGLSNILFELVTRTEANLIDPVLYILLAGVFVGTVGAGSVWIARNKAPDGVDSKPTTGSSHTSRTWD